VHFEGRPASALHTIPTAVFTLVAVHRYRKNYAGIGYTFDAEPVMRLFPPNPFASWVLNEQIHACGMRLLQMPADAGTGEPPKRYTWDEATTSWVEQGA
jgi:hypothetical protein